ncbi:MAG: cation:proton antiporter [Clostridia bacterium]|nr:cation:proton antiporter [Clostridia bacterium]
MLTSLALIFLVGLSLAAIFGKLKLPRLVGLLLTGILIGPFVLDLLDPQILGISAELRRMALVIILIKAGLSLNFSDLKKVGRPALLMSFLPATLEIVAFFLFAPILLGVSRAEALMTGSVLAAVSPAVVVPRMVALMDEGRGTDKNLPQLILAGASLDDIFVIVLFTAFLGINVGGGVGAMTFLNIPISIVLGITLGTLVGFAVSYLFELFHRKNWSIRNTLKTVLLLGIAFFLLAIESWLEDLVAVSGLLAIMSMAMVYAMRTKAEVVSRLKDKYGKIWLAAEVLLFALVGAAVDIRYTLSAGFGAVAMILIGLVFRSLGVFLCLLGTNLNKKERLYTVFAYLPKATVQAAIGAVPLSMGLPCGNIILSVAVLGILITAPLGAILMDSTKNKLLQK